MISGHIIVLHDCPPTDTERGKASPIGAPELEPFVRDRERREDVLLRPAVKESSFNCRPIALEPGFDELRAADHVQAVDVVGIALAQYPVVRYTRWDNRDMMGLAIR